LKAVADNKNIEKESSEANKTEPKPSTSGSSDDCTDNIKNTVKRKSNDNPKSAKKRRFFDDLDESSDDSE